MLRHELRCYSGHFLGDAVGGSLKDPAFILERRLVCFWTTKAILDDNYFFLERSAIERVLI